MSLLRRTGMWLVIMLLALSGLSFGQNVSASNPQEVTRGEFTKAIVEALDYELGDGTSHAFTDVDKSLASFVEAAQKHGLVKGTTATTFKPNQKLTREHAFLIASRAVDSDESYPVSLLDKFKDKKAFKTNESQELAKSVGLNIFRGYQDGTAKPQKVIIKGQVKKIIDRVLEVQSQHPGTPSDDTVDLRIMGTSDIHTNFVNYDYYQDAPMQEYGLAKTALLIEEARKENPNNVLLDNGDLIQGTPLGAYKVNVDPLKDGEMHPAFAAFNILKYDAMSLGNHEFNYGLEYLQRVIDGAEMPVINATVLDAETKENKFEPYVMLDRKVKDAQGQSHDLKIGVIGVVTPGIMGWDKSHLGGKVIAEDPVVSVNKFLPKVKKEGADIVVVISHSGIGDETYTPGEENVTYQLSEIDGVDAILTGHDHGLFPGKDYAQLKNVDLEQGKINGTPVVMPGKFGSHLGIIDLQLEKAGDDWKVAGGKGFLREIDKESDKVDQRVIDAVKEAHEGTIEYVRSPVGETKSHITSYFAQVQDDPSVEVLTQAQTWYVKNELKGTEFEKLPLLSVGAPFKAGGRNGSNYYTDIPKGEIAIKNVADLYVHDNTIVALVMTGADVKEWLEMSAGQFNQIDPASSKEQVLVNDDYRSYNFDVIDGVTYEVDVTKPAKYDPSGKTLNEEASRIVNFKYEGNPVDPDQKFVLVTNNYRSNGNFPGVRNASETIEYAYENREAIMDYLIEQKTIDPTADNNWTFVPIDGTPNTVFISAEKAKNFITEGSGIKYIAPTQDGFAKYSIKLK
ncbi:bifunctional 2',3'-cyclic-nucleotide 2'-phosphodiesterase/3'-nucleotidase [Sporosarcina sp.]|uniref:bifunctional 2',3'-cyclic-nucleotide 2'-phosphodiesterase/3'-nucleotidase n=1 Tax=Sporosarcina sp. TaxID=49982 RepID=UPI0026213604|nr:bifunctional 2',3'-cyclic-nucleotide 2'-phosphodiesterase/3'-nucleotidase [Sporosarcina sp.]